MDNKNDLYQNQHPNYPPEPKKSNKIPLIIIAAIVLILGANFSTTLMGRGSNTQAGGAALTAEIVRVTQPVTELGIRLYNNAVTVGTHSGSYILVTYTPPSAGNYVRPTYQLSRDGMSLEVVEARRQNFNFSWNVSSQRGLLNVLIPEDMAGALELLSVSTTSGRIEISGDKGIRLASRINASTTSGGVLAENFAADSVTIGTTSGGVRANDLYLSGNLTAGATSGGASANNITADSAVISSTSGGARADNLTVNSAVISSTSGGVRVSNILADSLEISGTSGGITANNLSVGTLNARSSSGGMTFADSTISGSLNARASSGGITLSNVDADENQMSLSTSSGQINVNGRRWGR